MKYKAFISYKHSDQSRKQAVALESALKRYAKPLLQRPIKIFRDESHLTPGIDLPDMIRDALENSEFLLYMASKESAESTWVQDEIAHWCEVLKRTDRLIIVHIADDIAFNINDKTIDWDTTNALPSVLEGHLKSIPLYVDLTWAREEETLDLSHPRFKALIRNITARFRRLEPNDMDGEEVRIHKRNIRIRNTAILLMVFLTIASVLLSWYAEEKRQEANNRRRELSETLAVNYIYEGQIPRGVALVGNLLADTADWKHRDAFENIFLYWQPQLVSLRSLLRTMTPPRLFRWKGKNYLYIDGVPIRAVSDLNVDFWYYSKDDNLLITIADERTLSVFDNKESTTIYEEEFEDTIIDAIIPTAFSGVHIVLWSEHASHVGASNPTISVIDFRKKLAQSFRVGLYYQAYLTEDLKWLSVKNMGTFLLQFTESKTLQWVSKEEVASKRFVHITDLMKGNKPHELTFPQLKEEKTFWMLLEPPKIIKKSTKISPNLVECDENGIKLHFANQNLLYDTSRTYPFAKDAVLEEMYCDIENGLNNSDELVYSLFYSVGNASYVIREIFMGSKYSVVSLVKIVENEVILWKNYTVLGNSLGPILFSPNGRYLLFSSVDYRGGHSFSLLNMNDLEFLGIDNSPVGWGPKENGAIFDESSKKLFIVSEDHEIWSYVIDSARHQVRLSGRIPIPSKAKRYFQPGEDYPDDKTLRGYMGYVNGHLILAFERQVIAVDVSSGTVLWQIADLGFSNDKIKGIQTDPTLGVFTVYSQNKLRLFSAFKGVPLSRVILWRDLVGDSSSDLGYLTDSDVIRPLSSLLLSKQILDYISDFDRSERPVVFLQNGRVVLLSGDNLLVRQLPEISLTEALDNIEASTGISKKNGLTEFAQLPVEKVF